MEVHRSRASAALLWGPRCPPWPASLPGPDVPAVAKHGPAGTPILSAWREEGSVLGSLGEEVLCPRVGLTPHIYDLNLYSARRGSKCLLYCCVHTRSGVVNRLFCV